MQTQKKSLLSNRGTDRVRKKKEVKGAMEVDDTIMKAHLDREAMDVT